jgi:hypothetical protein
MGRQCSLRRSKPKIVTHPMKEPISEFHLDELNEEAFNAFTELWHVDEFQMRTDGFTIRIRKIGKIFRLLKVVRETLSTIPKAKIEC